MSLNNTEPRQDEYKELREIIWYELGDGLNATDVDEACITIGKLIADRERQAYKQGYIDGGITTLTNPKNEGEK